MSCWIDKVAAHHNDWVKILKGFGADYYAEDIVQEMYITLLTKSSPEKCFRGDKVYFGFIYVCLRNAFLNYLKQKNKFVKVDIDTVHLTDVCEIDGKKEFEEMNAEIRKTLSKKHWYYEALYTIYTSPENPSYRSLAKQTDISFMTIANDMKKIKGFINQQKIEEKWKSLT